MQTPRTAGVVPPPILFLIALAGGLAAQAMKPIGIFGRRPAGVASGLPLITLGVSLSAAVVRHFNRAGTPVSPLHETRELVIAGPYRFSRNPDYLGQTLLYSGIALTLNSLWVLLAAVPVLLAIRFGVIPREERYLERLFGDDYRLYCQFVDRWL